MKYGTGTPIYKQDISGTNIATAALTLLYTDSTDGDFFVSKHFSNKKLETKTSDPGTCDKYDHLRPKSR